jgi:antirestriction protein ArdC
MNPTEIRQKITEQMINALQQGTIPWRQPWIVSQNIGMPRSFHSNRRYTGINPLLLNMEAQSKGFQSCQWGTNLSWARYIGATVKSGEDASIVVLFRLIPNAGKNKDKTIPYLAEFEVYNAEQVTAPSVAELLDGRCIPGNRSIVGKLLDPKSQLGRATKTTESELWKIVRKYVPKNQHPKEGTCEQLAQLIHDCVEDKLQKYRVVENSRHQDPQYEPAEQLIKNAQAKIIFGGGSAYYSKCDDTIHMPNSQTFDSMTDFYETLFHELAHWARKNFTSKKKFDYAFEELVAEISACFLLTEIGVPLADSMMPKSQSYVVNWLKHMQNDPKFIFEASQQAGKVVDFLLAFNKKKVAA